MIGTAEEEDDDELGFLDDERDEDLPAIDFSARLTCPRCGQASLVITSEGIWD
jgi:hypothetical protein